MSHSKRVRVAGAVVALVGVLGVTSLFGGLGALAQEGGPEQIAEADQQGREAIEAVGDRLPEVAAAMDMAPQELASVLANDSAAWLDTAGRLYYVDPVHAEPAEAAAEEIPPAPKPLSETFKLHSLPGAKRVIYLDFDGYEAAGSVWANGRTDTYAEPWSRDGDDSTFSDSERQAIQEIWRLVAEDFAPFAVDVTTEDPGIDRIRRTNSGDDLYGTTVAISPNIIRDCSCGGVAYVDVFDVHGQFNDGTYVHDYYQPAWVVGSSGTSVKTIAEAASHEAGHNLSLGHDGTSDRSYFAGHGDWAPIMGVGYYRSITQWSRGEYSDANNSEDDLALIDAAGAPIRTDDHGHDAATGTALTDSNVDVSGVIATRSDKDAFSFTTAGGQVTVAVAPAQDGPNLDTSLALVDSAGNLVASSTSSGLGSSLDQAVGAGTYALVVDGVGAGDPSSSGYSDYASLGNFTLTGTVPLGVAPPPPPQSCEGLTRQAEDGQMFGGFVAGNNGGTGFAWVPTGQTHNYTGADTTDSRVDLSFTVSDAGLYRIDTRVLGPTWDADSFYVTVDGGPAGDGYLWDTVRSSTFQTDSVSNRDGLDPLKVDLSAGEHIVSFHLREAGTALDWATLVAEDPDPRPTCSGLTQNAADGTLLGDFVAGDDGGTSFAWVPTGQPHNYNGADATESRIDLCFNVTEAGAYKIDTTVLGPTWDADSFYVTVDGAPGGDGYLWDTVRSPSFQSDPVSDRGGGRSVDGQPECR